MSLLAAVTSGKQIGAQIHVIAGNNGVGKTTWAASFPSALVADLENGSMHIDVARVPQEKLPDLEAFRSLVKELLSTDHQFKSFVVDSVESLEGMISDFVCSEGKVNSIEQYDGGYGKGYTRTREIMRDLMSEFQKMKQKGITVILVAHTQVKSHTDPATNQTWDRVIMRCNDKMAAIIRDLADNVFYASYKVFTTKEKGKSQAFGDGQRVLFTQYRPGFDAKNRLDLPLELPLSYDDFAVACKLQPEANIDDLISDIKAMLDGVKDDVKKMALEQVEKFKTNPTKLKEVKNRLMKYVAQ